MSAEPVAHELPAGVRPWAAPDTVTVLTAYVVLLFAIPSDLRIGALGGAGSLAGLLSTASALWWCWFHLQRSRSTVSVGANPVRTAALVFLGAVMASYVAAMSRPISALELRQADIGVLRVVALLGIMLLCVDQLPSLARLRVFLSRFVWLGAGLAALGLAQFVTGRSLVDGISVPGMTAAQDFSGVSDRGGFVRAAGTAMSPLEYGSALSTVFPIALTFALYGPERRLFFRWAPTAIIGGALLLSGSRSALLGLAVGGLVLFFGWSARIRVRMMALGAAALVLMFVAVPGLVGTLRYLFTSTSTDSSAQSRSGSYDLVIDFFLRSPVVGRGFGTFLPEYRILDNEYLLMLIELGLLGLAALLVLVAVSAAAAIRTRRYFADEFDRQLGMSLAAGVLASATLTAFFDALSFPMAVGGLALSAGLCGGYWRLAKLSVQSTVGTGSETPSTSDRPAN